MKAQFAKLGVEVLEGRVVPSVVWVRVTSPNSKVVTFVRTEVPDPPSVPAIPTAPAATTPIAHPAPTPATLPPVVPAAPQPRAAPTPTPVPTPTPTSRLTGSGSGLYVCNLQYGTTPTGFHFNGTATVNGMGTVDVQADVYGVGFKTDGQATGQVTFSNAQGSLTLKLTGPTQPRLSTLPQQFQYQVASATGAFRSLRVSGTLQLIRTPDPIPVRGGIRYIEIGSFRITL